MKILGITSWSVWGFRLWTPEYGRNEIVDVDVDVPKYIEASVGLFSRLKTDKRWQFLTGYKWQGVADLLCFWFFVERFKTGVRLQILAYISFRSLPILNITTPPSCDLDHDSRSAICSERLRHQPKIRFKTRREWETRSQWRGI
jgi:hypothetical protein